MAAHTLVPTCAIACMLWSYSGIHSRNEQGRAGAPHIVHPACSQGVTLHREQCTPTVQHAGGTDPHHRRRCKGLCTQDTDTLHIRKSSAAFFKASWRTRHHGGTAALHGRGAAAAPAGSTRARAADTGLSLLSYCGLHCTSQLGAELVAATWDSCGCSGRPSGALLPASR